VPSPARVPSKFPTYQSPARYSRRGRTTRWPFWLFLLALVLGAWYVARLVSPRQPSENISQAAAVRPTPAPVVAVAAWTGDIPVSLNGLGTVTALQTVNVKSRVDGQLVNVAFREGQFVRQGDLLAEIDARSFQVQLEQAEGQLAKDEAALKNAGTDLQRYQILVEQNSIPRQQLDTQLATVTQAEGALKSDQAQIDGAKLNLAYTKITAPISGRVGLRLIDVGNMVRATDQNGLVVITQIRPIAVVFAIPEEKLRPLLPKLRAGARPPVEAYDRDLKRKLATGRLLSIDNQIDPTTGTVKLKAEFPNSDESLFPNQFVNARVLAETLHGVVIVPSAAVHRSGQKTFVYRVKPNHTIETCDVAVRLTEGDRVAIERGLSPGDEVVTDGIDKLRPGVKVTVRLSDAKGGP